MDSQLETLSSETGRWLTQRQWRLATAESCTGGWIAEVMTATAGSSTWFDCGFVTYSNESKQSMLGVATDTLQRYGAVSEETVLQMVSGTLARSRADIALAVSGIAGPSGGTADKPVGTVCIAWGRRDGPMRAQTFRFNTTDGNVRESVRRQTVITALTGLMKHDR